MSETARLVTAEELEKFPDDDHRYELVEGRLIPMSPVGTEHGRIVVRLAVRLGGYVEDHNLGLVGAEVGFKLASNPDTVRGPDLAFIRRERITPIPPRGFWPGPPDLAIEVLSPDDRATEVREKVDEYLARDTTLVLVVDPDKKTVTVHRRLAAPHTLDRADDVLEFDDIVPGFHCTLRDVFD